MNSISFNSKETFLTKRLFKLLLSFIKPPIYLPAPFKLLFEKFILEILGCIFNAFPISLIPSVVTLRLLLISKINKV